MGRVDYQGACFRTPSMSNRRCTVLCNHLKPRAPRGVHMAVTSGGVLAKKGEGRPVALIIGAGSGIGSAVARRFAAGGFTACVVRRSDKEKLDALAARIRSDGGEAHAFMCDCTKEEAVVSLVSEIEQETC